MNFNRPLFAFSVPKLWLVLYYIVFRMKFYSFLVFFFLSPRRSDGSSTESLDVKPLDAIVEIENQVSSQAPTKVSSFLIQFMSMHYHSEVAYLLHDMASSNKHVSNIYHFYTFITSHILISFP